MIELEPGQYLVMVVDERSLSVRGKGIIKIQRTINAFIKHDILKGILYIPNLNVICFQLNKLQS
jgi:hypothetical protein